VPPHSQPSWEWSMSTNSPSQHGSSCPLCTCPSACSRSCSLTQCVHAWSMHSLTFPLYTTVASAWWSCAHPPLNGQFSGIFYLPSTFLPTESPLISLCPLFDLFTVQSTAAMAFDGVGDPTGTDELHAPMVNAYSASAVQQQQAHYNVSGPTPKSPVAILTTA
jgi:hypothetical protein